MDGLSQEKIDYLREFLIELHSKMPHRGDERNEQFLDNVITNGFGLYEFSLLDDLGIYGHIHVEPISALITLGYIPLFLRAEIFQKELEEIATKNNVQVYVSERITESLALGFANISIFRDNANLTVDELVLNYVFNISRAAKDSRSFDEHYLSQRRQKTSK